MKCSVGYKFSRPGERAMFSKRISVRISERLCERLAAEAAATGRRESDLVREALAEYLASRDRGESAYEVAKRLKLLGCARDALPDLSTNPDHFEGFAGGRAFWVRSRRKKA